MSSKDVKDPKKTDSAKDVKKPTGPSQLSGEIGKKYKLMVQILCSDPRYAKALADVAQPSQHEALAGSLTNVSYEIGASLGIIKALIGLEFNRKHTHPFTILRVNSIVSKMIGKYAQKVGNEYLVKLLGGVVKDIHDKPNEAWELDKAKMTGDDMDKRVEDSIVKVIDACQVFVDRITSKVMIDEMPRQLRAICYFMANNGELYNLDKGGIILPLVSGFVMLRYIVPAITNPQNCGIVAKVPTGKPRDNLITIGKIIQKMSNGEKFETESPHLMVFNNFIEKNQKPLMNYFAELTKDPEQQEGRNPFGDLQKTVTFEDIHYKTFDTKDLTYLHQMIYEYGYELVISLQNEVIMTHDKRPVSIVSHETEFLALIQDLGPVEDNKPAEKTDKAKEPAKKNSIFGKKPEDPKPADKKDGEAKKRENLKGKTYEEIESTILERTMDNLLKKVDQFDLTDLDQSRFLYIGKPTKQNVPVAYLILSRIQLEFLSKNDQLMVYIFKTLQPVFSGKYVLVVDLSWSEMDDEMQAALYRAVISFSRLVKQEYLGRCQQLYILHPNFKTQQAIDDILNMIPPETRKSLIKTAYDWMDLSEAIEPNKIWIPFVSKKFTPLTYHLVKVNNNDKRQERFMKVTNESLLNIDSKACIIKNEIMLQKIEELRTKANSQEIIIKFMAETEDEIQARGAGYFIKEHKKTGVQSRKYNCYTDQQREVIVEAIFEAGIRSASLSFPQCFHIDKENKKGKKQKITVKFTLDSILIFKETKVIKEEVPFSTVQSFYLDEKNKKIMYINFMLKGKKKCYVLHTEQASTMRDALLDAIKRFKFSVQIEKDLLYKKDFDSIMDRFFSAARSKETKEDDDSGFQVYRIDQPCNDLKKLFKKFKPKAGKATANMETFQQVIAKLKLNFKDDQIKHVMNTLDKEESGVFTLDDLIKAYVYIRREKQMFEKRKEAAKKRQAAPPAKK